MKTPTKTSNPSSYAHNQHSAASGREGAGLGLQMSQNYHHQHAPSQNFPSTHFSQANEAISSGAEKFNDGMKVCKGPFNVNCTTDRDPQELLMDMVRSLEHQKVSYKKIGSWGLRCQKNSVRFEMEINHLDEIESIYILKFKRLAGEIPHFKDVSARVLNNINLNSSPSVGAAGAPHPAVY
jgi:Kinase associated domain 1